MRLMAMYFNKRWLLLFNYESFKILLRGWGEGAAPKISKKCFCVIYLIFKVYVGRETNDALK